MKRVFQVETTTMLEARGRERMALKTTLKSAGTVSCKIECQIDYKGSHRGLRPSGGVDSRKIRSQQNNR